MARVSFVEKGQGHPLVALRYRRLEFQGQAIINLYKVLGHCPSIGLNWPQLCHPLPQWSGPDGPCPRRPARFPCRTSGVLLTSETVKSALPAEDNAWQAAEKPAEMPRKPWSDQVQWGKRHREVERCVDGENPGTEYVGQAKCYRREDDPAPWVCPEPASAEAGGRDLRVDEDSGRIPADTLPGTGPHQPGGVSGGHGLQSGAAQPAAGTLEAGGGRGVGSRDPQPGVSARRLHTIHCFS